MENSQPENRLKEITDKLEHGIQNLFVGENYAAYLRTMSKFHNYSFGNALLIHMQRPDATHIAGYNAWKKSFGRQVKRGEHGIKILAPCPYTVTTLAKKCDRVTGKALLRADGSPVMENVETTRAAFRPVTVFDVSQTEGKELPTLGVGELTGDVEQYEAFLAALKRVSPLPIAFEPIESGAKGYCSYTEHRIAINEGMSQTQNIKTAIHEITHATLHEYHAGKEKSIPPEQGKDRNTREVEAESVAYTVCQHYGVDTSDYSFSYIAAWGSGQDAKELKGSLELIRTTAAGLIDRIDAESRERSLAKEPEQAAALDFDTLQAEIDKARKGTSVPIAVRLTAAEYEILMSQPVRTDAPASTRPQARQTRTPKKHTKRQDKER